LRVEACGADFAETVTLVGGRLSDRKGVNVPGNQAHASVLLTACGYSITEQGLVERFCGMSDREMLDIVEREWGRTLPAAYAEHVGAVIEAGFRQSLAAIEGIAEMLDALSLPICVASSSTLEQIREKLELTGLLWRFGENLFSATMVARDKPAPDLFLYAATIGEGTGLLSGDRGQPCRHRGPPAPPAWPRSASPVVVIAGWGMGPV